MGDAAAAGGDAPISPEEIGGIPVNKRIEYRGVVVGVIARPEGSKEIHVIDPASATEHVIPIDEEHARQIGNSLAEGGIQVASPEEAAELGKLAVPETA